MAKLKMKSLQFNLLALIILSFFSPISLAQEVQKPAKQPFVDGIRRLVDLSHPLEDATLHWPTNDGFKYTAYKDGEKLSQYNVSYYIKADSFSMAVHTGTHLDAPRHYNKNGWSVDEIPIERLVDIPVVVVNVSQQVALNRSYLITKDDLVDSNSPSMHTIRNGSIVLIYTGISQYYDQGAKAYFGTDTKELAELSTPGFSLAAAEYLTAIGVYGVGLDSPSVDSSTRHGPNNTLNPVAHTIFAQNNIYNLENLSKNLKELVENRNTHFYLTCSPLAIKGGSGSPARVIVQTAHDDCLTSGSDSHFYFSTHLVIITLTHVGVLFYHTRV